MTNPDQGGAVEADENTVEPGQTVLVLIEGLIVGRISETKFVVQLPYAPMAPEVAVSERDIVRPIPWVMDRKKVRARLRRRLRRSGA